MTSLESKIEAVLFWKGEPMSRKRLGEILDASAEEIDAAILKLRDSLTGRGIVLQELEKSITLGTTAEMSKLFEDLQKEELNRDLSKASLETLSIILYKNGASRPEIDFIRGVNSSFTLRALSVRGLIEKTVDPKDSRRFIYKPSFELLSYMGIQKVEDLPDFAAVSANIHGAAKGLEEMQKQEEAKDDKIVS